jgi:hypothetical protein
MNTEITTTAALPTAMIPAETTSATIAAQVRATVEARYALAVHRPRNLDDVRVKILNSCKRPAFAHNKSVLYRKPIGAGVEGLGIRFVEEAMRCMGNIMPEVVTVYDDPSRRIVRVAVTDLEANLTYSQDLVINKTVERSRPDGNGAYLSVRSNSQGKEVYTVLATDDEFSNKESALVSKAIRSQGLRLIPGDIKDEAEEIIRAIRRDRAAQDPAGERKRVADAFAALNITPANLEDYLGHGLVLCTPTELVELRGLYEALRDGETTWLGIIEEKLQARAEGNGNGKPPSTPTDNPVVIALFARIASADTVGKLESVKPDVAAMKGAGREQVKSAFKERKAALLANPPAQEAIDPADVLVGDDYISEPAT